jgi:hypothetical protein
MQYMADCVRKASPEDMKRLLLLARTSPSDAASLISRTQALDADLLTRFADKWDWMAVSCNTACAWSIDLIEGFRARWYWDGVFHGGLTGNKGLPWSDELIDAFKDDWDWRRLERDLDFGDRLRFGKVYEDDRTGELSRSESLPWTEELIGRYADRWDWELLSGNRALPWSHSLIERFKSRWDWHRLSSNDRLPWSSRLVYEFRDSWDWSSLLRDQSVTWSREHFEEIRSAALAYFRRHESFDVSVLPVSVEFVERHFRDNPWPSWELSCNTKLPWSAELIRQHHDYWDWEALSANTALAWSPELINEFAERWDWTALSSNQGLPWSDELISRFEHLWSWEALSQNAAAQAATQLTKRYSSRWSLSGSYLGGDLPAAEAPLRGRRNQESRERASPDITHPIPMLRRHQIIEVMECIDLSAITHIEVHADPFL